MKRLYDPYTPRLIEVDPIDRWLCPKSFDFLRFALSAEATWRLAPWRFEDWRLGSLETRSFASLGRLL